MHSLITRLTLIALALGLLLGRPAPGHAAAPDYLDYTLDNGLRVVLIASHEAPVVAVDVWYNVGGANDPPGRSGFAHLFEHLMFQGTPDVPRGELDRLLREVGANPNATTRMDLTNYFVTIPAHELPRALWLEADRMRSLEIDEPNFLREREVVKEEYRQRYENRAYAAASLALYQLVFAYEPYRQAPIGSIEDLDRATVDEVMAFHQAYYQPGNATLVVAGDVDFAEAQALVEEYFGAIPAAEPAPPLPAYVTPDRNEPLELTVEDRNVAVPATYVAYAGPGRGDPDYVAIEVLMRILSGGGSGRLDAALLDTQLAAFAGMSESGFRQGSLLAATLGANDGVDPALVQDAFDGVIEQIRLDGVTPDELTKAINQLRAQQVRARESALGLAESVNSAIFYHGDPSVAFSEAGRYLTVASEDVQRVVTTYLSPSSRVIVHVVPAEVQQ